MNCEEKINNLINQFDGNVSLYAIDEYNNEIKVNENRIVESASCIKIFILIEYYNQILKKEKSRNDLLIYNKKNDYVANGSGIIQYLDDNLTLTSRNMAILMMILSDNIATNKMIEYLGFDKINESIKLLGFTNTQLVARKIDFTLYDSIGKTTAYEYANIYKMLFNKEILTIDLCNEIIEILSNQTKNEILVKEMPPKYIEEKGTKNGFIKYIASKSGGLGNKDKKNNCRNDGGIICTTLGTYMVSIFINGFSDYYFYSNNPASILGTQISKVLFENFEKNSGKFLKEPLEN